MPDDEKTVTELWAIWDACMTVFKDHRAVYSEAKAWLLHSLSALPCVSAAIQEYVLFSYVCPASDGVYQGSDSTSSSSRASSGPSHDSSTSSGHSPKKSPAPAGKAMPAACGSSKRAVQPQPCKSRAQQGLPSGLDTQLQQHLLLMMCEQQPREVVQLLAQQPSIIQDFFSESDRRIMLWFSHFSMDGMSSFKYGAKALAHYALMHRDVVWQLLVWEGKHAQAPVSVATKTHYFCELDVVRSVRAFLRHCPDFWRSNLFLDSLVAQGELLQLEPAWFAKVLAEWLVSRRPEERCGARRCVRRWLQGEQWQRLMQRTAPLLTDDQLLQLVRRLGDHISVVSPAVGLNGSMSQRGGGSGREQGPAAEVRLCLGGAAHWASVPQLVLTHALSACRAQLMALLESEDECRALAQQASRAATALYGPGTQPSQVLGGLLPSLRPLHRSLSSRQLLAVSTWLWDTALRSHALHPLPADPTARSAASQTGLGPAAANVLFEAARLSAGAACQWLGVGPGDGQGGRQYALLESSEEEEGSSGSSGRKKSKRRKSKARRKHRKARKEQLLQPSSDSDTVRRPAHAAGSAGLSALLQLTVPSSSSFAQFLSLTGAVPLRPGAGGQSSGSLTAGELVGLLGSWRLAQAMQAVG
ncbi:hypothetical protein V8C86DRAFT_2510710 [Haematococcus lacustris]